MQTDNFAILGRTVPEISKKYGYTTCMAGYSIELRQFLRIFPLKVDASIKCRDIININLERNNKDNRHESWALKTRNEKSIVKTNRSIDKSQLYNILNNNISSSVKELNNRRASLGIIKPNWFEMKMKFRKDISDPRQLLLFDDFINIAFKTGKDYYKIPYILIDSENNEQKCLQLREWGCFELIRKNPSVTIELLKKALNIKDKWEVFFFIGNMNNIRNRWIIIKVFTFKPKGKQLCLF